MLSVEASPQMQLACLIQHLQDGSYIVLVKILVPNISTAVIDVNTEVFLLQFLHGMDLLRNEWLAVGEDCEVDRAGALGEIFFRLYLHYLLRNLAAIKGHAKAGRNILVHLELLEICNVVVEATTEPKCLIMSLSSISRLLILTSVFHADTAEQPCVMHGTLLEDQPKVKDELWSTPLDLVRLVYMSHLLVEVGLPRSANVFIPTPHLERYSLLALGASLSNLLVLLLLELRVDKEETEHLLEAAEVDKNLVEA